MTSAAHRIAVLDVESVPDGDALAMAARQSRGGHGRTALHRLVAATVLTAVELPTGFAEVDMRTFAHPAFVEADMIGYVDLLLPAPEDPASILVVYNGAHDLRLLRHRASARWMFDLPRLSGWCGAAAGAVVDLIVPPFGADVDRWSLSDTCAGLGLPIRRGPLARTVHRLNAEGHHDAVADRNRLDVIGTFIAYAHRRAFETGREALAASAWAALPGICAASAWRDRNVEALECHHLVSMARTRLSSA